MTDPWTKPKPKKPRPWDLDASRTGSVVLVVGVVLSFGLHSGIPMAGLLLWPVKSISQLPVTMEFESLPLPPADEIVESPDDVDSPDDDPDVVDDVDPTPTTTPPDPKAPKKPDPKPVDEPADEADPVDEPADEPDPVEPPVGALPPDPNVQNSDLQQRMAERDAKREEWLKARARAKAVRDARRAARNKAREGARKGGAPEGGDQQGNPQVVHLCTATELGPELQPRTERPISAWMPIVPTVFAHFDTRPNLADYLGRTNQVYVPRKRIGLIDFAAPPEVLNLQLESGTRIAVGRLDGRCLIGLRYRPKLFPIQLMRLPARIIDKNNKTVSALINLTIFKDASIEIVPFDKDQPELPFKDGRFKNGAQIARNIDDHFQALRLANAFAELFGLKKPPPPKKERKPKP